MERVVNVMDREGGRRGKTEREDREGGRRGRTESFPVLSSS